MKKGKKMHFMNKFGKIFAIGLIFITISSCTAIKETVLPTHRAIMMIQSDKGLNPNEHGRPSPLSVYVYQLKEEEAFSNAEFFPLYEQGKETLGDDYLGLSKISVAPNIESKLTLKLKSGVNYLGIVAAYRDVDSVQWRLVLPVSSSWGREKVRLRFTRTGVELVRVTRTGTDLKKPDLNAPDMNGLRGKLGPNMKYEVIRQR
jgi:type VI secretion system protein VasD